MRHVCLQKPFLLAGGRVQGRAARVRRRLVVVIVAPFREVVCEFEARRVRIGVLEVDDDEALVLVCGEEEG